MTFLELVQELHKESGIAGAAPSSVENQTGMNSKLVRWVRNAWLDIQALYPGGWKFLRTKITRTLTPSKRSYALVADLGLANVRKWMDDLLFIRDPVTGQRWPLKRMEWDEFERTYDHFNSGRPSAFCVTPDYQVNFNATPDKAYQVDFAFWLTGERLDDGEDVPSIPEDYHFTIVWLALLRYCTHEGARDVKADAKAEYAQALRRLEMDQLDIPTSFQVRPLA